MKSARLLVVLMAVTCGFSSSQEVVQYFPPRAYSDNPTLDAGVRRWYSKSLNALDEPSLWTASKDSERQHYRFLWLRTWDHPISVRVDGNADGTATLTLKVTSGSGGYEPGKLDIVRTKKLSKEEFDAIADRFTTSGFWTMASTVPSSGRDGAQWVLEAAKSGRYSFVNRWSPRDGAIRDLALHLLRLSEYKVAGDKVY